MSKNSLTAAASFWIVSVAAAYFAGSQTVGTSHSGGKSAAISSGTGIPGGTMESSSGSPGSTSGFRESSAPWSAVGKDKSGANSSESALSRLRAALANPNAIERSQGFLGALEGLDNEGMKEAMELINAQGDWSGGRYQTMMLMYAWGRKDPEAALAYNKETGNERSSFSVLSSWAEVSPDNAMAWAKANAPVDENGQSGENWSMVGVVHGLLKADTGKAAQAVESMGFGQARARALDVVMEKLWKEDPASAQNWVKSIADVRLRGGAAERVAERMAESDPAKAADWIATLSDASSKARAAAGIIENWSGKDPNAAGEWINSNFPVGPESDRPRENFAYSIDRRDPQSSLAWAATISDQRLREETIIRISLDWLRRDAQNARTILENTPNLPQGLLERLGRQ